MSDPNGFCGNSEELKSDGLRTVAIEQRAGASDCEGFARIVSDPIGFGIYSEEL